MCAKYINDYSEGNVANGAEVETPWKKLKKKKCKNKKHKKNKICEIPKRLTSNDGAVAVMQIHMEERNADSFMGWLVSIDFNLIALTYLMVKEITKYSKAHHDNCGANFRSTYVSKLLDLHDLSLIGICTGKGDVVDDNSIWDPGIDFLPIYGSGNPNGFSKYGSRPQLVVIYANNIDMRDGHKFKTEGSRHLHTTSFEGRYTQMWIKKPQEFGVRCIVTFNPMIKKFRQQFENEYKNSTLQIMRIQPQRSEVMAPNSICSYLKSIGKACMCQARVRESGYHFLIIYPMADGAD